MRAPVLTIMLAAAVAAVPVCAQMPGSETPESAPPVPLSRNPPFARNNRPEVIRVGGDTLTSNPRAYRAWLRRKITEDLATLYAVTGEIVATIDTPSAHKQNEKHAERVVKLSHNIWNNLQMRKPSRPRPKADKNALSRSIAEARADALIARNTVREIAERISSQQRSGTYDAANQIDLLEKLEQVELIGYQLKRDVRALSADERR